MSAATLQMTPMFSTSNITNGGFSYSIFGGHNKAVAVVVSYFKDLFFGKFCLDITNALGSSLATLTESISVIVGICAEKQMIGVDAVRDITMVKDEKSFGDNAVMNFPGDSMGQRRASIAADSAVSPFVNCSGPQPATRCRVFINMLIKTILNWFPFSRVMSARHKNPPRWFDGFNIIQKEWNVNEKNN